MSHCLKIYTMDMFTSILLPMMLGIMTLQLVSTTEMTCPERCSCPAQTVSCSGTNQSSIPGDLPPDTIYLCLERNNITILQENSFSRLNHLKVLKLGQNKLTDIKSGAFSGLSNLETLRLENNSISSLPDGVFATLTKLSELRLNGNRLLMITKDLFGAIPSLSHLYLGQNGVDLAIEPLSFAGLTRLTLLSMTGSGVTQLIPGIFTGLARLQTLDLSFNNLRVIERNIFSDLLSLLYLRLDSNNNLALIEEGAFERLEYLLHLNLSACAQSHLLIDTLSGLSSVEELLLSWNSLDTLQDRMFCNTPKLLVLELDHNPLTDLRSLSFQCLTELRSLRLNDCKLTGMEEGVFEGLAEATVISLSNNQLVEIPNDAFQGKPKLSQIYSDFNRIERVNVTLFRGVTGLQTLTLNDNRLQGLPEGIFDNILVSLSLTLANNPLRCDCHIDWLDPWMDENGGKLDKCECDQPPALHGRHISSLLSQDFHCKPARTSALSDYYATVGNTNYTIVCPVYGKPTPSIEWLTPAEEEITRDKVNDVFLVTENGSLLVTKITPSQTGQFTCTARNILGHVSVHVNLHVDSAGNNNWIIVVFVVAILIVIVVFVLGFTHFSPRRRRNDCWRGERSLSNTLQMHYDPLGASGDAI